MTSTLAAPAAPVERRPVPQWKEALAGAVAGAFSKTALAPVERVKLLKQLQGSIKPIGPISSSRLHTSPSAWQVAINVYRREGLLAFWRGNLPNVYKTAGTSAINFTCMDYYKKVAVAPYFETFFPSSKAESFHQIQGRQRKRRFITSLVSSGLAGASSTTLLYPFEFLRTRLAMDVGHVSQRQFVNMRSLVSSILETDGIRGFFQGYGIALAGGVIYRILFLGGYDALKDEVLYQKQQQQQQRNVISDSVSSSTSASLSWTERMVIAQSISLSAGTACYPFDSVRRRMMMQAGQALIDRPYRSSLDCLVQVLRHEGVRGFYLGIGPNLVRSVSGALLLVGYDAVRSLLRF